MSVVIETTIGCVTVDLFVKERPTTCLNFLKLCKMKYYNFCLFHSVQSNFIAQTGDPTGTGNGGESIFGMVHGEAAKYYEAEVMPRIKHDQAGLISMVNCGNNMLGSQFFFTLGEDLNSLDGEHCVFGVVAEGMEVLIQLNEVICDEEHHPFRDIRITHTVILEDPFSDLPNLVFPDQSPEPTQDRLMNGRIAPDEEVDDTKGKTLEEVEEMVQKREAQARATILEIVGDIPDAEIAPPENILFVCKLNPITTEEELEILFARFGAIKSCEVIKDKKTGESLQYAFIEFEDKDACETAYLTMDNVLIDDRRIHVDFSQSVAKMRWRGKGKGVEYLTDDKQRDLQRRLSKDGNVEKVETREKKRRSRTPERYKWRNQSERENLEKYQERRDKVRDDAERRYKKSGDCSRGRNFEMKGHDYRGPPRNPERVRDGRDWNDHGYNWDKRMRNEGRANVFYGRTPISERQMEMEMSRGGRERRNRGSDRSERRDADPGERHRSSKESFSKSERRMEDNERLGSRSERSMREDMDVRHVHGEFSRYEEQKLERISYKQKRYYEKYQRQDVDSFKYGPDVSSENEERLSIRKRRRYEDDRERVADMGERYGRKGSQSSRGDEYRSHNYSRSASDDQTISRISGRDNFSKERGREQRNANDVNSDDSVKYELSQSSKHAIKDGRGSKMVRKDIKVSKRTSSDSLKKFSASEKVKKDHGSKGRKVVQKRKRYSSSSSCCSDSSCSCGSSCCSSSSESDDSDCETNSELSESCSSSSTSPDRKTKSKKTRNKKKRLLDVKKGKKQRGGHRKRPRSSSESSDCTLDEDNKSKHKSRRKKVNDSSSSEHKGRSSNHSQVQKLKKKRKSNKKRKADSSESSSEESSSSSSSSDSVIQRKSGVSKKKKSTKEILPGKKLKSKKKSMKHKGKKGSMSVSTKKKKKKNDSISSDSSDSSAESESADSSSREDVKHKKEL